MNKNILLALVLLLSGAVKAQPTFDLQYLKTKYAGYSGIVLNRSKTITFSVNGENLRIKGDHVTQVLTLDKKGFVYNENQVPYSKGFYEIAALEACTYVNENGKLKKHKVTNITDEGNMSDGSVFYDGMRYKKFFFNNVEEGSVTESKYTYNFIDPSFLGGYYFMLGSPSMHSQMKVIVPENVEIGYRFLGDSTGIKFTEVKDRKNTIYTWTLDTNSGIRHYNNAVDDRYYEPHVFVFVKKYKTSKGSTVQLFGTVKDLYAYDYKYVSNVNKGVEPDAELKKTVDSIISISPTREAKIRNIYYWVQDHMKYIAFEDGLGGQIPREANDVYEKKYGDCKDFSSLITYMLKQAGIESYLTWIGSRDLPYTFEQLPLGYATDHMIASVWDGSKWVFVDGTSKHTPYGVPSGFIQGKEAMISISPDSFVVTTVPLMPPSFNYSRDSVYMTLDNRTLKATGTLKLCGYNKSYLVDRLYYTGTDKIEQELKDLVKLGNNKCDVKSVTHNNIDNKDSSLDVSFTFNLPDYVKFIEDDIYINMHLRKVYQDDKIDTVGNRKAAREFKFTFVDESAYAMKIPAGYKLKKVPSPVSYKGKHFSYAVFYETNNDTVVFKQMSQYDKLTIEQAEFDEWNKQIEQLGKSYKDLVVFTKIK